MKLPFHIIQLLKEKSGNELRQPSDCEFLSLDIESKTGVRVGATTLKRLLGFAQDERVPHTSTLDAIARYLGYAHWEELSKIEKKGNSDFSTSDEEIRSADLKPGVNIEITYLPDRKVRMQYLSNQRYRIVESENSKLLVDDEVEILDLALLNLAEELFQSGGSVPCQNFFSQLLSSALCDLSCHLVVLDCVELVTCYRYVIESEDLYCCSRAGL